MSFEKTFNNSRLVLAEGAFVERLKYEFNLEMDANINHAGLIYEASDILETLYQQYIDIAIEHRLPIMIMTPTRKLNSITLEKSKYSSKNIISDSCKFLNTIKDNNNNFAENIFVGGLLGCKGDAYSGTKIMEMEQAYDFHRQQSILFSKENVDFLFAGIMPELNESMGMAKAMAETNLPYIISFMLTKDGCLMDGTLIADAIKTIDEQEFSKPLYYMTNCIHPTNLKHALNNNTNKNSEYIRRFKGIQANASCLSPEELNNCEGVFKGNFDKIVDEMIILQKQFNLKVFGGCCGTNEVFFKKMAEKLKHLS